MEVGTASETEKGIAKSSESRAVELVAVKRLHIELITCLLPCYHALEAIFLRALARLRPHSADDRFLVDLPASEDFIWQRYALQEEIGRGSCGRVYASGDPALCVKVVPLQGQRSRLARLEDTERRELLAQFGAWEHPNVARHWRCLLSEERLYIVMDRCCGASLEDHLMAQPARRLPPSEVCLLAEQLFAGIAALHDRQLMHRDVKASNFRFADGAARHLQLLDLDLAKRCGGERQMHTITGTLLYVAPEVLEGLYCRSCDLWSAGILLFLLLLGELPFDTADPLILQAMHRDPVMTGDGLFRGERDALAPPAAQSLLRGLLVDANHRLDAHHSLVVAKRSAGDWLVELATVAQMAPARTELKRKASKVSNLSEAGKLRGNVKFGAT